MPFYFRCLDEWFGRNRCCPAHPDQIPQEYQDTPGASSSTVNNTNEASGGNEASAITSPETINMSGASNESANEDQTGMFSLDEQQLGNEASNGPPSNRSIENGNELLTQAAAISTEESSQHQENSDITLPSTNHINVQESNPVPIQTLGHQIQVNSSVELTPSSSSSLHNVNTNTTSSGGIPPVEECSSPPIAMMSSSAPESSRRKPIVHVDDGSIHGSPNNLDEEEIAQLASKIFVSQQFSPRRFNSSNSSPGAASGVNSRRDYDGT